MRTRLLLCRFSVVTTVLYFWQPFVDHQAVMKWIVDNAFMGSIAACSIFGTFFSHKVSSQNSRSCGRQCRARQSLIGIGHAAHSHFLLSVRWVSCWSGAEWLSTQPST